MDMADIMEVTAGTEDIIMAAPADMVDITAAGIVRLWVEGCITVPRWVAVCTIIFRCMVECGTGPTAEQAAAAASSL